MVSREAIDSLNQNIATLSEKTQKLVRAELENIEFTSFKDLREKTIEILNKYSVASEEIASAYASSFYDQIMEENGEAGSSYTYTNTNEKANDKAVRSMMNGVVAGGSVASFYDNVLQRVDYNIRKISNETILESISKSGKRLMYARVPSGKETCAFCFMLASRGFSYWSRSSAGEFNHYHSNCDCRIVPGFSDIDPDEQVEGYKPSELYRRYKDCERTVKDPISIIDGRTAGWWDYDLFQDKYVKSGKYKDTLEDWERWKRNRVVNEIRKRDTNWLWTGKPPTVTFETKALETEIMNSRPHEIDTARRLTKHGIRADFRVDYRVFFNKKTGRTEQVGLSDFFNGYEIETLTKATSRNTLNTYLKMQRIN